jgi:MFS family permease
MAFIIILHYIFILEIFTGLLWGSFEIAFFVTTFEEIPSENQGQMMTLYNLIHTICIGLGCFMGAFTFYYLGNDIQSYHIIFFVSGLLRLSSVLFFPRKKLTESKVLAYDLVRLTGVRPNMGMISRPFWQAYGKVKKHLKQNESKDKSQ